MDAVEFLDKVDRLSKRGSTEEKMRYNDYRTAGDNTWAVKFVEQWAAAHPAKTRQSEFLEQWPNVLMGSTGTIALCPKSVNRLYRLGLGCDATICENCKKEFWLAEVEE